MPPASNELLTDLLAKVSRSFYLTLRVLPQSVRNQLGLAYLLARTTDTVADTELVPLAQRLQALQALRERIQGTNARPLDFGEMTRHQGSPAERVLLEECEASLTLLQSFSEADRKLVRQVLGIIISGQDLDLRRFAAASAANIVALQVDEELDDYTYRVAGCVGEFWTKMCRLHVFPRARLDEPSLLAQSVRFGKGLQLVNILRDLPADLRLGRCYLPAGRLSAANLAPRDLLDPANESKLRPIYDDWLARAAAHLAAGWEYTNTLPWRYVRVRLACAWPVLIGIQTIGRLVKANVLDPQQRVKIDRGQVRNIIRRSVVWYAWPAAWRKLFSGLAPSPRKV